jgi:hypothetical protein
VANIKRALDFDIPTLVLFRDPLEAISSSVVRFDQSVQEALLRYEYLYSYVIGVERNITLVDFESATSTPFHVVKKFGKANNIDLEIKDKKELEKKVKKYIKNWTKKHGKIKKVSMPS